MFLLLNNNTFSNTLKCKNNLNNEYTVKIASYFNNINEDCPSQIIKDEGNYSAVYNLEIIYPKRDSGQCRYTSTVPVALRLDCDL